MAEEQELSWLEKLRNELSLAQPPKETEYVAEGEEKSFEAPRNLVVMKRT